MTAPAIYRNKRELISAMVRPTSKVLDVGFLGQGIQSSNTLWPHGLIRQVTEDVYGVDLEIDRTAFPDTSHYQEASAESFSFPGVAFDIIFAGDLIEHLPNPGLFLECAARHLATDGRLIVTTPNCFNLFNLTEKISKSEPTVNADHTCYFNSKTLRVLLKKCSFDMQEVGYVYSLEYTHRESFKKKVLNALYRILAIFTPKYLETLVVVAQPTHHG